MKRILLIEDDEAIADALRLHLKEANYYLHHESDGLKAMSVIKQQHWDLVLLDIMLPGADGWEVCRYLRSLYANIPIIILSARSAEAHRVLGLELGADDYLAKPFSMLELVARIRALFRRVEQLQSIPKTDAELRFGHFRLDLLRRTALRGDQQLILTLREFDLLYFLARHPGRVFTRNELLHQVWGSAFDGFEHTVNSHINRLRIKIEDNPSLPRYILTVWGVGYRFEISHS